MQPPPLQRGTSATVELVPYFGLNGEPVIITIIKQRFVVDILTGRTNRLDSAEIRLIDEPWDPDAPETSSIRYPSDLSLSKPSTDVIVSGAALVPVSEPQPAVEVLVRVGPVEKALTVFGPRIWDRTLAGTVLSAPEPFEQLDLRWEYAYGGSDYTEGQTPIEEPRNPVGRGVARDPKMLIGQLGPRIEDPGDLIANRRTRPAPAGVGPIGRNWEPRRSFVGTVDERWMEERMPLLPLDFDPRFNQVAPPELIAPHFLRGGEQVQVLNMNHEGPMDFRLPMLRFHVGSVTRQHGEREHRPVLDTVLLEPNDGELEMTWRAIVPATRRANEISSIKVHEKRVGGLP